MEMLWGGDAPEVSSFYMFSEGPFALAMVKTLIKLVDLIMEKAKFPENEVTMARGFLKKFASTSMRWPPLEVYWIAESSSEVTANQSKWLRRR
ncbi:hypothetical protein OIU74_006861 [Salix koriyanagi]|uniref:Uncharacterized protein n=1 Tax=Salix koriyanagi TaxID=2511006 RepID=A0A9Q0UF49_9ROSI|nr:hypothetical protein OIU74_006861 [Salix koriyanagi]